ncbi:MAG: hypothetical protein HQL16_04790 [Candidatus Omnitrophica bacterium]|nr:hypothetical protein [Candidatus Omnitrophota bacterium]
MFIQRIISICFLAVGVASEALAQSSQTTEAAQATTKTEFGNLSAFIVTIITGPVAKIIALVLLLVGIWKIINKDYGTAVGCILALLVLIFLPQILTIFG